jgi:5-methylcytosine-specific restriction endonuclease McrA
MPIRLCLEASCPEPAVYRGRCATHAKRRNRETTSENKAVYNSNRWKRLRAHYLLHHSICERCDRVLATEVHHKRDISRGGNSWAVANLEALCKPCHSQITRQAQMA